jgi:methionyl-tRNA formyltransferase
MKIACITHRKWAIDIYEKIVKTYKGKHDFLVLKNKDDFSSEKLKKFNPDLILWYGWSWIVEKDFVRNYESIMLHPSPLPKYRGGSPIQNQIINGEKSSAVTLFKMNEGIDKGDIYQQLSMSLEGTLEEIFNRMIVLGYSATCNIIDNNYKSYSQDDSKSSFFNRRTENQSEITLDELKNKPAEYLYNKIRMLADPYPNSFIKTVDGKKLVIKIAEIEDI